MTTTFPKRAIRPCTPEELAPDPAALAQIFWCLRRYASLAYARQAAELLRRFIGGLDAWARKAPPSETAFARRAFQALYPPLAALEEAPALLLKNLKTRAYDALDRAGLLSELEGQGFNLGTSWIDFGFGLRRRPSTGLYAYAERALAMTTRIRLTAAAEWATTRILSEGPPERLRPLRFPARLDPLPAPRGPVVDPGEDVPVTGVYVPLDIPGGCPNFLVEARPAPPATVETTRVDTPAWPGDDRSAPHPATTEFVYAQQPTRWQLAWEDLRYRTGVEPDESEFLDDETDFPPWPPVHPPLA